MKIQKIGQYHQDLYWLVRFTGMRVAKAAGIELNGINLDTMIIDLVDHSDSPLKTKVYRRQVPIHPKLVSLLKRLKAAGVRPFLCFYKPQHSRWTCGNNWRRIAGSNAHSLRHHAATSMKDVGFSDFIIGSALGHFKGSTMTSTYGSVDLEKVRAAIEAIS
ncbi:MAG: tyrosine-type recombinase/integrase [Synechococcus sp. ChSW.bin.154]